MNGAATNHPASDEETATVAHGDSRGSMIANRTPWLNLPEPWDNLEIRGWLDYPADVADDWTRREGDTPDELAKKSRRALKATFLAHRGADGQPWKLPTDEHPEGEALPPPSTDEFWDAIPTPLAHAIVKRFNEEMSGNPTSRASASRNRKRRN